MRELRCVDCGGVVEIENGQPKHVDLVAAVRRGVESGTIEGEVVGWCETHERPATETTCGAFVRDLADEPNYNLVGGIRDCRIVPVLVIPVDGGES